MRDTNRALFDMNRRFWSPINIAFGNARARHLFRAGVK